MNLKLFIEQLKTLLNQPASPDHYDEICGLLKMHLGEEHFPLFEKSGAKTLTLDEQMAVDITECVGTLILRQREDSAKEDKKRRAKAVRAVVNSLSFSELEAATYIVKMLENGEGLLIAGHVADKLGFTRSVVTGALRKLEGANLIETRSLGMKGTYIRVKDALLSEELGKL
jgi:GTP-sensing pleiotropic transcriptional regulator CodY